MFKWLLSRKTGWVVTPNPRPVRTFPHQRLFYKTLPPLIRPIILFLFCLLSFALQAQNPFEETNSGSDIGRDTVPADTIPRKDTLKAVLSNGTGIPGKALIVMSPDSIDAPVNYGSVDSNYFDNSTRKVHLYGNAFVKYKDLSITAAYIVVDLDSSIATAEGRFDSLGQLIGRPEFKMGDETFMAERMRYNFKKRKGFIYNALTQESDMYIHGRRSKLVAANPETGQKDDILYGESTLVTTCDHPSPHFGIRARKVKTIPDKLAVIGASNLEVFGVPTPLWLPFGFYPVSETRKAGLIFPRDYEQSPQWGFGLRDLGYYFPVKDWADVKILGDIYFNGTWGLGTNINYVRKYKFRGNLDLRYSKRISEPVNDYRKNVEKSFSIRLTHNQDAKAHPYQTIGGSINIQSNNFEQLNYNDAESALTNSYSSNFNYSRTFPGKPYSLTASMNHSQNTRSHVVTINAPDVNFRLNRIYPFKRKQRVGPEQWYERIAFQYSGNGKSQIATTDTSLFDQQTWQNAQWGMQHRANANVNFNVAQYFNVTPSIDYGETWFFKTQDRMFRFDPNDPDFVRQDTIWYPDSTGFFIMPDTIDFGNVESELRPGFQPFRSVSASVNISTQIFGTLKGGKGWFRGFRHVVKPSIGFSFTPKSPVSYYENVPFSVQYPDSTQQFSKFDQLLYSVRPTNITQANLNYSFTNLLEAKFFSKKDSTEKKIKFFDNIGVSGSYNMAADSFRWSPVNISGNTRLFKGLTTISIGATYSFYDEDENGRLINKFYWDTKKSPLRFDNLRLRFSTRLRFDDIVGVITGKEEKPSGPKTDGGVKRLPDQRDKLFDLLNNFSISHELGLTRMGMPGRDTTLVTTHTINLVGSMQLTPNWSVQFGNIGYDLRSDQLTYPDLGITRNLHCWSLSFSWQPVRGTYAFYLGVKPGTLDFLKFPARRGNQEVFGF